MPDLYATPSTTLSEVLNRLAAYEDTGFTPEEIGTIKAKTEHEYFTAHDLETLECVLMSAIFDCQSSIAVLKCSSPEDNYKRDQLALNEKNLREYTTLLEKIRKISARFRL